MDAMTWDITDVRQNEAKLCQAIKIARGRVDIMVNSVGVYDTDRIFAEENLKYLCYDCYTAFYFSYRD